MDQNQEILVELQKINQKIDKYINPLKISGRSFLSGTFHSLGTLFGTLVVATVIIYFLSKFNFTPSISKWIETTMSQVNWTKIIAPQIQTTTINSID